MTKLILILTFSFLYMTSRCQYTIDSIYFRDIALDSIFKFVDRKGLNSNDSTMYLFGYKNGEMAVEKSIRRKGGTRYEKFHYCDLHISLSYDMIGLGLNSIEIIKDSTELLLSKEFEGPDCIVAEAFGYPYGTKILYHDCDSTIRLIYEYYYSIKHGIYLEYYVSGELKAIRNFKNDKVDGYSYEFYQNGNISACYEFKDGEMIVQPIYYDIYGKIK